MAIPSTGYDTATITNPSSALTDFTLIVDLSRMSTSWWAAVNTSDGTRGRAAKNDGTTELATDWIDFDDTAETGLLRVKWSGTLASSGTQVIRIYPPNTTNTAYDATDTYGQYNAYDSATECYWANPLDLTDRTGSITLTQTGTVTEVDGLLGKAAQTIDSTSYLSAAQSFFTGNADVPITMIGIIKSELLTSRYIPALLSTDPTNIFNNSYKIQTNNDDAEFIVYRFSETLTEVADVLAANVWNHIAGVERTTSSRDVWYNGTKGTENTSSVGSISGIDTITLCLQDGVATTSQFQHISVHSVSRSSAYVSEEYSQTNDNATFWGTWTWNSASTSYTIDADTGAFTISGLDVGLLANREISAESGNYNITGSAIGLLATRLIGADSGAYNIVGSDVSLDYLAGFTLDADSGTFTINGSDVELERTYVLNADSGDYDLTGSYVQLIWSGQPLANGYVCMTLSGKTPQIIYTARKPEIAIGGKGCK